MHFEIFESRFAPLRVLAGAARKKPAREPNWRKMSLTSATAHLPSVHRWRTEVQFPTKMGGCLTRPELVSKNLCVR